MVVTPFVLVCLVMSDDQVYKFGLDPVAPPKLDDVVEDKELSVLDRLRGEVSKKIERSLVFVEVPERKGVLLKVSPNISQEQLRKWRRASGEGTKNEFDPTKFATHVIAHTTRGILFDNVEVFSEAGHPLSFASPEILEMTDTTMPIPNCVKAFFGLDPHIEAAALAIMEAAGYSDTVEAGEDPTKKS